MDLGTIMNMSFEYSQIHDHFREKQIVKLRLILIIGLLG